eukprot:g1466.t1
MPGFVFSVGIDNDTVGFNVQYNFKPFSHSKRTPVNVTTTEFSIQAFREALEHDKETIDRLRKGGEISDDSFLQRWLNSRNKNIQKAVEALQEHSKWRADFFPNGYISDSEISTELKCNKCFLQGSTNEGNALLIVMARRHDMNKRDFHQTQKLICYTLDVSSALADHGGGKKICCLFDLSGLRLRNLDVKVLSSIFELLQQHYPERLSNLWFINAPFIFWAAWKIVAPLLEECSRQKMKFVNCRNQCCPSFLNDSVPEGVLPVCYGGKAALIPINIAAKNLAPKFSSSCSRNSALKQETASKQSWKTWYKSHARLSKCGNWIWHLWTGSFNNHFTRRFWNKMKGLTWRQRDTPKAMVFPQNICQKQRNVRGYFYYDPKQIRIGWFILMILVIHLALLIIGQIRSIAVKSICGDESFYFV